MAYITLQPELIQELVDLVRVRTEPPPARDSVPLDISVLAVHCLAALVHTRYLLYTGLTLRRCIPDEPIFRFYATVHSFRSCLDIRYPTIVPSVTPTSLLCDTLRSLLSFRNIC